VRECKSCNKLLPEKTDLCESKGRRLSQLGSVILVFIAQLEQLNKHNSKINAQADIIVITAQVIVISL